MDSQEQKLLVIEYREDIYGFLPRLVCDERGDWIDCYAAEEYEIKSGNTAKISLGFAMRLPAGYEAHILPRSSAFERYGVIPVTSGLIDNSYCGRDDIWFYPVLAMRDTVIHKGDRICQFRIVEKQPNLIFKEERLSERGRGASLNGSGTGQTMDDLNPGDAALYNGIHALKAGDTVYMLHTNEHGDMAHSTVHATGVDEKGAFFTLRENPEHRIWQSELGKTVFLLKQDARAAYQKDIERTYLLNSFRGGVYG